MKKLKSQLISIIVIALLFSSGAFALSQDKTSTEQQYLLLPAPKQINYTNSFINNPFDTLEKTIKIDTSAMPHQQGYALKITPEKIHITAHDKAGVYYAEQTINQILQQSGNQNIRCLTITDWPDFPVRGVMLDISRDKVPTMDTLFSLVKMLASWKINHFQLYTEHTFAYKNHEVVWKDASPMTADQIRILDSYCKDHLIDLVPNQNSFGHMNRWLTHKEYRHLAEAPSLVSTRWGKRKLHTLYPADPGSIELVSELYDELLPNFSSKYFNVGCDETVELGNGRSKQLCEEIGTDKVYLDYLLKVHALVKKHGRTMMFWADMLQNHPETIDQLPKDIIAMIWGYRATHPFDKYCKTVADTGCEFYVCPGNSTWLSIAGQTDNAKANLINAAENGLKYGATGFVNTDWGDLGSWEPITVSYLGYAYGAALSWSVEENRDIDLPAVLDEFAFKDEAKVMGKLMYDLGNAYTASGVKVPNSTFYGRMLLHSDWNLEKSPQNELTIEKIEATKRYVDKVMANIDNAKINRPDSQYIIDEIKHTAQLIHHGCDLGIARLNTDSRKTEEISKETRDKLASDIKEIMANHKRLWLRRNRPGGLTDSVSRMENQLSLYELYMY